MSDADGHSRGWLGSPARCVAIDAALIVCAAAAGLLGGFAVHGAVRLALTLASAALLPGAALLTRLRPAGALEALALAVPLSFLIEGTGTLAMIWSGLWDPALWAIVTASAASAVLALDLRANAGRLRPGAPQSP